jgi:hypothetical protein
MDPISVELGGNKFSNCFLLGGKVNCREMSVRRIINKNIIKKKGKELYND